MKRFREIKKSFCIVFLGCLVCISSIAFGQQGKIPPFRIVQPNGKIFKAEDLPAGKPIIIIYFSPECDHCDVLMKELCSRLTEFNKASIAMITYLPIENLMKFQKDYNINKYPNIYAGSEGTSFFVRDYYKITEMPFVALYTKNGDFIKSYSAEIPLKDLGNKLNHLK